MDLLLVQDKNRDNADNLLVSCLNSFTEVGILMLMIAWHLYGFSSYCSFFQIFGAMVCHGILPDLEHLYLPNR